MSKELNIIEQSIVSDLFYLANGQNKVLDLITQMAENTGHSVFEVMYNFDSLLSKVNPHAQEEFEGLIFSALKKQSEVKT